MKAKAGKAAPIAIAAIDPRTIRKTSKEVANLNNSQNQICLGSSSFSSTFSSARFLVVYGLMFYFDYMSNNINERI